MCNIETLKSLQQNPEHLYFKAWIVKILHSLHQIHVEEICNISVQLFLHKSLKRYDVFVHTKVKNYLFYQHDITIQFNSLFALFILQIK